jgi:pimeloyl-ACP methyl ester carboxylesterase
LIFVFLVAPYLLAHFITRAGTRPMDQRLTSSPADFDLDFEEVEFTSRDGVTLKGWYLGGADRDVSIACAHGLFRSRREVLERAVVMRRAGFNVLLFDLRRHGESGGERITLGYKERLDLGGAVSYLQQRSPGHRVIFFGVSMGAAAALLAAAEDPEIVAVIADSSFLSLDHTVVHHLSLFWGLPRFPLADELIFFVEYLAEFRSEDLNLEEAVGRIGGRPVLFIAGGNDRRMPVAVQKRLFESAQNPGSRFVVVEGAGHGAAFRTDPETYRREMLSFLEEVLNRK